MKNKRTDVDSIGAIGVVPSKRWLVFNGIVILVAVMWAYWPSIVEMVDKWNRVPDYSHGYLVLPLSVFFLWKRRSAFPGDKVSPSIWGIVVLLVAGAMRAFAGMYYLMPLDGWTLPITIGGCVWLLCGWACLRWSLPSVAFLWFMIPIPYRMEHGLSVPLQAIATKISTAVLVLIGQPAISEGNTILMGEQTLFVEEACSGLRIFFGVFALAFAFLLFSNWSWWQKSLVLLATLPVAVLANVSRIVITGLLYQLVSTEAGQHFSHDFAGLMMIPFAALLFWLLLIYLDKLFPLVEDAAVLPAATFSSSP